MIPQVPVDPHVSYPPTGRRDPISQARWYEGRDRFCLYLFVLESLLEISRLDTGESGKHFARDVRFVCLCILGKFNCSTM